MGIFDSLGGGGQQRRDRRNQNESRNPMQMLGLLKRNPMGILQQAGYSIPKGMTDPRQMVNHLWQTGQIDNSDLQMIQDAVSPRRR